MMIEFKVPSAMYGQTDCVIHNVNHVLKAGFAPCGDGQDYKLTAPDIAQLKLIAAGKSTEEFFVPYIKGHKYWVIGPRTAWDTVRIGLFLSKDDVDRQYPIGQSLAKRATAKEVKQFFKL